MFIHFFLQQTLIKYYDLILLKNPNFDIVANS